MKFFLKKLLIFLLPFLFFYPILEINLSRMPIFYSEKKEFLESHLSEIEILSTGSSHGNAINPQFLSHKDFNLFNYGQDIYYDVLLVEKYLDRIPNLKMVIFPISYFSLEYRLDHTPAAWQEPLYKFYWDIPPQDFRSYLNIGFFSYTAAHGWQDVRGYIENGFVSMATQKMKSDGWTDSGVQPMIDSPISERSAWQEVNLVESVMMDPSAIEGNLNLLSKFIEFCQSRHIKVMFITTPVYHYYYDHIDPLKYQRLQDNLEILINRYHVPYFNFLKDPHFVAADFHDPDHLNAVGAEKFSKMLDIIISKELDLSD